MRSCTVRDDCLTTSRRAIAVCLFISMRRRAAAVNFERALVVFDHAVRVARAVLATILVTAPVAAAAMPIRVSVAGSDGNDTLPAAAARCLVAR
eukprot:COSAG01_NODE_9447_length_2445_cov_3.513214_2_plen_94_part_00